MPLTSAQLAQQVLPFAGLVLVSFAYLTIDLYQQVNSLKAIWSTVSFWMLWLAFSFLDLLAFDLLRDPATGYLFSPASSFKCATHLACNPAHHGLKLQRITVSSFKELLHWQRSGYAFKIAHANIAKKV